MSSSPAPNAEQAGGKEEITFRFCRECSNMLYPKEDRAESRLMFACRTCQFSEPAPSSCVYRNTLSNTVGETAGVTQDVGSDPTVSGESDISSAHLCALCGEVIGEWMGWDKVDKPATAAVENREQERKQKQKQVEATRTQQMTQRQHHISWLQRFADWDEGDMEEEEEEDQEEDGFS